MNDRLGFIRAEDKLVYLQQVPEIIQSYILKKYLFDDIIYNHRFFFNLQETKNSKFLYDICFGMMPAKFDNDESDKLILDEEDIVTSMYFI